MSDQNQPPTGSESGNKPAAPEMKPARNGPIAKRRPRSCKPPKAAELPLGIEPLPKR
jgi:hypothetical protein